MALRDASGRTGVTVHHLGRCFANDDEAHDDGLLRSLVHEEIGLAQPVNEAARIRCGLLHMVEVIRKAVLVHTGCASASTWARNFGDRSAGVNK